MDKITLVFKNSPEKPKYTEFTNLLFDLECLYYAVYIISEREKSIPQPYRRYFYRRRSLRIKLAEETNLLLSYIHYSSPLQISWEVFVCASAFVLILTAISSFYNDILLAKDKHEIRAILIQKKEKKEISKDEFELLERLLREEPAGPTILKRISESLKIFGPPTVKLKRTNDDSDNE